MKAKRKKHDAGFKARVALEALKGEKIIQQIARDFDLHPVQVSEWKKKLLEGAAGVFASGGSAAAVVNSGPAKVTTAGYPAPRRSIPGILFLLQK